MKTNVGLLTGILSLVVATSTFAAPAKTKSGGLKEVGPGAYQATVKAIVCDGCGDFIQKTMSQHEGIESVVVDQKAKLVNFRVKDGAKVKLAELQTALKASADKMGMGADYTLANLKKVDLQTGHAASPAAAPASESSPQQHHH